MKNTNTRPELPALAQPVFVTGANGFIGRHLVRRLLQGHHIVHALVLPQETIDPTWNTQVQVLRGDITQAATVAQAMQGMGTVFHLAAVVGDWGPESVYQQVTVKGTEYVLQAAVREGSRVVLVTSLVVYGKAISTDVCAESHPHGQALGHYSRSKQQQEELAWDLAASAKLALSIVRPGNVYGAGCRPWVHDVIDMLHKGLPVLLNRGLQNAGLCYVDNVVDVLLRAAALPQALGRTYNVCDDSAITWRQYFSDLARFAGTAPPRSVPFPLAKLGAYAGEALWRKLHLPHRPPLTHEALNLVGSHHRIPIERARRELGFEPLGSYEQHIQAVAQYIRDQGLGRRSPSK